MSIRPRLLPVLLLLAAPTLAAAQAPRDPALPYGSWGEAQRETADAIAGRTLARPADGRYFVGDAVIFDDDGKRYRAHVIAVADRYTLHYDGFADSWKRTVGAERLLGYQPGYVPPRRSAAEVAAVAAAKSPAVTTPIAPGKWGCSESYWRIIKAEYEFEMRGSFVLNANGTYEYPGQRSRGRWRWDAATSAVLFTGGFFDRARAMRLEDSPRIRLELPTGDPERPRKWACGPA